MLNLTLSFTPSLYLFYNIWKFTPGKSYEIENKHFSLFFLKLVLLILIIAICFSQFLLDLLIKETTVLIFILQKSLYEMNWIMILCTVLHDRHKIQIFPNFLLKFYMITFFSHLFFKITDHEVFFHSCLHYHRFFLNNKDLLINLLDLLYLAIIGNLCNVKN